MAHATPRKSHEPTVVDLETGVDSLAVPGVDISQSDTPASRSSLERAGDATRTTLWPGQKQWRQVADKMPQPVVRVGRKVIAWLKGPQPPRVSRITPFLETAQTWHMRVFHRLPKGGRAVVLLVAFVIWIVLFGVVLSEFSLPTNIGGFGQPVRLSCISRLWPSAQSCGLDGRNCLPFDESSFAFACPADCAGVQVLNPYTIGDTQITYRPLVVGGASNSTESHVVYRGDSFICGAAIHAGALQDSKGGCGVLSLGGGHSNFGAASRNGISSVGFESSFPMSISFNRDKAVSRAAAKCRDPRWDLLTMSTIITGFFGLFASTPAAFFVPVFVIVYFQIAMASDPPGYSDYPSLASTALGNFLPVAFIGVLTYQFSVRKTLKGLNAHFEKTVLWLGGCWVGALSNITLEKIPIQRLTPHDLNQQPGAITALVVIVLVLVAIVLFQAWCFRNEGRLLRYLGLYAIIGIGLLLLLAIPRLNLRIHHYILALLLLPGTALQTRPSLLFQGLLVGLFINGVARWGFAPILQTAAALRGDAQLGGGIPSILPPLINSTSITFTWEGLARGYEGVSVLVNDVERFRGFHRDGDSSFTWERERESDGNVQFFRFGFVNYMPFGGVSYSDFTRAGRWWANGTWEHMPPGRSRA